MASSQHRCVFVGNIPYDASEEQLIEICQEVGPVVSFRLVIDRETGKPKGYGFCEYKDEETALSARRNLQGYEINGRQLRVDFAENDKGADRNRDQGRGGPGLVANADAQKQTGGTTTRGESNQHQPIGLHIAITAAAVMAGALGGAQVATNHHGLQNATMVNDPLTLHLAKLSRSQLTEIMSGLKVMTTQNKELARQLLLARPQLSKALFQSQIMLGMVPPQMLQMPNLRQASSQPQLPLHDTQQGQPSSLQSQPGLPPLAPNRMQTGFVPKVNEAQISVPPQNSLAPHQFSASPRPPLQLSQALQHGTSAGIPGGSSLPSVNLPGNLSVRQQGQVPTPSSLKKHMHPPSQQYPGHGGAIIPGQNDQIVNSKATVRSSLLPLPSLPDADFQPGPSTTYGTNDVDKSSQVPLGADGKRSILHDFSGTTNRPAKQMRLQDGKGTSFSAGGLSAPVDINGSRKLGVTSDPNLKGTQISEKPTSVLQTDIETALLQQVLNLTPEQLDSLPHEQRQQVIQLQQALRRDQIRPS